MGDSFGTYYSRSRAERLKANGLCIKCGKAPALPGKTACQGCSEYLSAYKKKQREQRKASGLCTICGKSPSVPGKTLCAPCAERSNKNMQKYLGSTTSCDGDCENCTLPECTGELTFRDKRQAKQFEKYTSRLESGICVKCGREAVPGRCTCEECAKRGISRSKKRYEKLKGMGICTECGKNPAVSGHIRCTQCISKQSNVHRTLRNHRKEQGLCMVCGKHPARPGMTTCEVCGEAKKQYDREKLMKAPKVGYRINAFGKKIPPKGHCRICGTKLPEGECGLCAECKKKREKNID